MKDECYEFLKNQIGKTNIVGFGSYGQVKIARNTQNNQIVAIKLIHGKNAKQQIDVHHKLNHPNIIKLLNYYYQKEKNITYMVLQYAEMGSLNEKIKFGLGQLSKDLIRKYFKDICEAIKYLHKHNYMHRDIKPQNILITKDNVAKLCDFGFAAIFQARTTMCGTFQYMAPEMIKKKHYNYKIDIWALGILLFEMIQGIAPFRGQTGQQVISQMKKPIKFSQRFQPLQIDLIKKILRVNAQNRPVVEQILDHPYFKPLKQEEKISLIRNTVEIDSKTQKISQQPLLLKQKITSSKQQLARFLKNSNEEPLIKNDNPFDPSKKKSPGWNSYLKTEPASTSILSQSFRGKHPNNDENELKSHQQFRKYSNNFGAQSPQTQKSNKNISNKIQLKADNEAKTQKKLPPHSDGFTTNFNTSIKALNLNKSRNGEGEVRKTTVINTKTVGQKHVINQFNSTTVNLSQQFLNKSFKTIKPSNDQSDPNLKTNLVLQSDSKIQNSITSNNIAKKYLVNSPTTANSSFQYSLGTKVGPGKFQSPNTSTSYKQNYETKKSNGNEETGFSYNQIYNLQKSANIGSPHKLTKLKEGFK